MSRLHVTVKTAKGRKISSTKWLQRQLNDPFVHMAKEDGYRSRAAYKLTEMNEKYKIISSKKAVILELGAAPGGWVQVMSDLNPDAKIVAVDLLEMDNLPNMEFIHGDFRDTKIQSAISAKITELSPNGKVSLILSDMAPSSSGTPDLDHMRIMSLCDAVIEFAPTVLAPKASLAMKILQGGQENDLVKALKPLFTKVQFFKPKSSRKESREIYLVALGYKA